ncbi:hypothetical protein AKJ09_10472 [Labilithrix luteola]|uniref:Exo-alpha-sialidase n=1 Tax=Labilithrix luteola TaxID=1391654 RepID=A0A0K1QDH2_9BACT|nr:hypothetical protein [Labilithrix luteola]AKV03809.1 hypothetical protein AKJ09_10472 [Labilithrix luteola]
MRDARSLSIVALFSLVAATAHCSDASEAPATVDPERTTGDAIDGGGAGQTPGSPGSSGEGGAPSTPGPSNKADLFVAVGHMGRSVVSCDDGLTWIHDRSDNDNARCWVDGDPNYVECDHTASSSPNGGITYGDGYFYASYGWGHDGSIRRSTDGFTWETVKSDGWGGGVAYAKQNVFVLWEGDWARSTDHGTTWQPVTYGGMWDLDHAFPRAVGDRLFAVGRAGGAVKGLLSTDGGATWATASGLGQDTAKSIAEGNGVLVGIGDQGVASRSTDGGKIWASKTVVSDGSWTTNLLFDGTSFVAFAGNVRWTSPDGVAWSRSAPIATLPSGWTAAVGFNPKTKTYVAILNEWANYYEDQKAYRSSDGLTWTTLDAGHFKGGHPLFNIVVGQVDPAVCP